MRYFIELAYDGGAFAGWQRQTNAMTVQQTIEENLSTILNQQVDIVGCGRTDAGVHAAQYFAHFDYENTLPDNFLYRINAMLSRDIAIKNINEVADDKHARFSAVRRTYQYFLHFEKNPFLENYSFLLQKKPDIAKMEKAMQQLIGTHDFASFEKKGSDNQTSVCTVFDVQWIAQNEQLIFRISANRFLRNMVRAIVASVLMVGLEQMSVDDFILTFNHKKKMPLKMVVPAKGLFLWKIEY
jgi:tRNA pseudouridine38-40 synthase